MSKNKSKKQQQSKKHAVRERSETARSKRQCGSDDRYSLVPNPMAADLKAYRDMFKGMRSMGLLDAKFGMRWVDVTLTAMPDVVQALNETDGRHLRDDVLLPSVRAHLKETFEDRDVVIHFERGIRDNATGTILYGLNLEGVQIDPGFDGNHDDAFALAARAVMHVMEQYDMYSDGEPIGVMRDDFPVLRLFEAGRTDYLGYVDEFDAIVLSGASIEEQGGGILATVPRRHAINE